MSSTGFSVDRFRSQLKLSISRLVILQKKLSAQSLAARKEIADLLKSNKTDQAITKVRYIVRDDFMVEAMEIVQSFCDDLLKSSNLIASTSTCDEFILEQARSIIYASTRMDVPELQKVRDLLISKYTKTIIPDREIGVYSRLVLKLSMSCPERGLCEKYLEAIADNFGIEWKCVCSDEGESECKSEYEQENEKEKVRRTEEIKKTETERRIEPSPSPPSVSPSASPSPSPSPSTSTSSTSASLESLLPPPPPYTPAAPLPMDYSKQSGGGGGGSVLPDFDEFTRRFELLRKK